MIWGSFIFSLVPGIVASAVSCAGVVAPSVLEMSVILILHVVASAEVK